MKEIYDQQRINSILKTYPIQDCLTIENYHFFLIEYQKEETIISPLEKTKYLQFCLEGTIQIHSINEEGYEYSLTSTNEFTLYGDIEFVQNEPPAFFATALTKVLMLVVDREKYDTQLNQDIIFLHYLLKTLAKKITYASLDQINNQSLEERLIHYIKYHHNQLTHIEQTANQLHCSRRHLQRVIKIMCEEGTLSKIKKGHYTLNKEK